MIVTLFFLFASLSDASFECQNWMIRYSQFRFSRVLYSSLLCKVHTVSIQTNIVYIRKQWLNYDCAYIWFRSVVHISLWNISTWMILRRMFQRRPYDELIQTKGQYLWECKFCGNICKSNSLAKWLWSVVSSIQDDITLYPLVCFIWLFEEMF